MVSNLLFTFRHELVSTVLVSAFIAGVTMPFRKIMQAYRETKEQLTNISTELKEQRTNCLSTLSRQGDTQVTLLQKSVEILDAMRLDMRETLTHMRDKS